MQKQTATSKNRVCLACGQIHQGKTCPLIEKKLNQYATYKNKNYLIGNILLKCIEKGVDFLQILLEIAEQNEEIYDASWIFNTVLPISGPTEYFAVSLGCSSREFFKDPKKTVEEYAKLIASSYTESPYMNCDEDSGNVNSIDIPLEIPAYTDIETVPNYGMWTMKGYEYTLSKERSGEDSWTYNLCLILPVAITQQYEDQSYQKKQYPDGRMYYFGDLESASATEFLLASDCNGIFEKIFEDELERSWTEDSLIQEATLNDSRYEIWINKLLAATRQRLLQWDKYDRERFIRYRTFYEGTEIRLILNKNLKDESESIIYADDFIKDRPSKSSEKYNSTKLYVRNREGGLGICFRDAYDDEDDVQYDGKAATLARVIDLYTVDKENGQFLSELKKRTVEHTDVIVAAYSMICHDHHIEPLRGIVQLLTDENKQTDYEIYVGYCSECKKYYCFEDDYKEMLKHGTPLCVVYDRKAANDKAVVSAFRYKSQSVLNAMGYSVGMELNLTVEERQEILKTALQSELFEVHDLVSFLNWLIQTRKTQQKYNTAIGKWQEDLDFVKNYERQNRQKVQIEGMIVRK